MKEGEGTSCRTLWLTTEDLPFADACDVHTFGHFPHHYGNAFEISKADCIRKELRINVSKIWKGFHYNTDLNVASLQILIGIYRSFPQILQSGKQETTNIKITISLK